MSDLSSNDSERLALVIKAMHAMEMVVDGLVQSVKELAATGREVQRALALALLSAALPRGRSSLALRASPVMEGAGGKMTSGIETP